jgi:hypothetical protein
VDEYNLVVQNKLGTSAKKSLFPCLRQHLHQAMPFIVASATLLGLVSLHQFKLLLFVLNISLIAVMLHDLGKQFPIPKKWLKWAYPLQVAIVALLLTFFWLDYSATSASAAFFQKAEEFFKQNLKAGAGNGADGAIALVFNVMRALYLLYIAVALIGVVNAVRKDEDWQVIAQTPLLVVVAVTIADVLTTFIIGP